MSAGWFWILFLITGVLLGLNIQNSFIQLVVVILNITFLVIAVKKTFFKKKKEELEA